MLELHEQTSRVSLTFKIIFKDVGYAFGINIVGRFQDGSVVMGTQDWTYINVTRKLNDDILVLALVLGIDKLQVTL